MKNLQRENTDTEGSPHHHHRHHHKKHKEHHHHHRKPSDGKSNPMARTNTGGDGKTLAEMEHEEELHFTRQAYELRYNPRVIYATAVVQRFWRGYKARKRVAKLFRKRKRHEARLRKKGVPVARPADNIQIYQTQKSYKKGTTSQLPAAPAAEGASAATAGDSEAANPEAADPEAANPQEE